MEIKTAFFSRITSNTKHKNHTFYNSTLYPCVCVCVCVCTQLCLSLCDTPWTVVCQAPLSMGFCRQAYWSWLPFPSPGDLSDQGLILCPLRLLHYRRILYPVSHQEAHIISMLTYDPFPLLVLVNFFSLS